MRGDETNTFFGVFHMAVKPVLAVAVNENVFILFIRLKPDQVRILHCVRTETKGKAIVEAALRVFQTETAQGGSTFQKSAVGSSSVRAFRTLSNSC